MAPMGRAVAHRRGVQAHPGKVAITPQNARFDGKQCLLLVGLLPFAQDRLPVGRMDRPAPLRSQCLRKREAGDRLMSDVGVNAIPRASHTMIPRGEASLMARKRASLARKASWTALRSTA